MLPFIIRHFIFPMYQRRSHRTTLTALKRLRESQNWPADRLEKWQEERLRHILTHASRHVPYYRDLFARHGINPESAAGKDWSRIPLLSKETARENFDRLQATDRPRLFITGRSSGATGRPMTWRVDRGAESVQHAVHLRGREGWGLRLGDPHVMIWGRDAFQGFRKQMRDLLIWNKRTFSAMELSADVSETYYRKIRFYRPRFLRGYPSALTRFAQLCESRGLPPKALSLHAVITTAEVLTLVQRQQLRDAYQCPVANEYGCSEVQCIAFECPEGSMHIQSDAVRVEFIKDGRPVKPGELGEIVVTDLTNEVMPVIRYCTGDFGGPRDGLCACGRTLPLMELTIGRTAEFITLPDSRTIHTEIFTPDHDSILFTHVQQFRILHEAPARFRVQVVTASADSFASVREEFTRLITSQLGEGIEVAVERVTEISRSPSGKQPYFVSQINPRS